MGTGAPGPPQESQDSPQSHRVLAGPRLGNHNLGTMSLDPNLHLRTHGTRYKASTFSLSMEPSSLSRSCAYPSLPAPKPTKQDPPSRSAPQGHKTPTRSCNLVLEKLSSSSNGASCAYQYTYLALPTTARARWSPSNQRRRGPGAWARKIGRALELGVNWPRPLVAQPPVRRDPRGHVLGAWLRSEARLHFH